MSKRWFGGAGLVLALVLVVFFIGYSFQDDFSVNSDLTGAIITGPGGRQCDDGDNLHPNEGENHSSIFLMSAVRTRQSSVAPWRTGTFLGRPSVDYCVNTSFLREFYCLPNALVGSEDVRCDRGCARGGCNLPACVDSDNGINITRQGTTTGIARLGFLGTPPSSQNSGNYTDICFSANRVREYYCNLGFVQNSIRFCPSGSCLNGLCLPPPETVCDGLDNDGDGVIDEGCDDDNDGICDSRIPFVLFDPGSPYSYGTCGGSRTVYNSNCCGRGNDCNDLNSQVYPRNYPFYYNEPCGDELDNDCDGIVNEGCEISCDNLDNDENGLIDDGCDNDRDGYCRFINISSSALAICPNGGGDCLDGLFLSSYEMSDHNRWLYALVNPGASESCFNDYDDDNCDGTFVSLECSPFTCEADTADPTNDPTIGGTIIIRAANGEPRVYADSCYNNTVVNETLSCPDYLNRYSMPSGLLSNCPSGTTCSDPDGPSGPIPAVCS